MKELYFTNRKVIDKEQAFASHETSSVLGSGDAQEVPKAK